jgi:hypothetical protein
VTAAKSPRTSEIFHAYLTSELKLTPLRGFAIVLLVGAIDEWIIGYLTGNWASRPLPTPPVIGVIGASEDFPHWIVAFIFQPVVWALFLWLPPATMAFLDRLATEAIPASHKQAFEHSRDSFVNVVKSPVISVLSLAVGIALLAAALSFTGGYTHIPWSYALVWHRVTLWSLRILAAGYCLAYAALYGILAMFYVSLALHRYGVQLHLYHGDNVAGLKFIGDFAVRLYQFTILSLSFLASDLILAVTVGNGLLGQINVILEAVTFPTVTLVSFIIPIYVCHLEMSKAKIVRINRESERVVAGLEALRAKPAPTKDEIESQGALIDLRKRLGDEIPTFPIDLSNIRQVSVFLVASFLPAILLILNVVAAFNALPHH